MATPHVKAFHYHRGRVVNLAKLLARRHAAYMRHGPLALSFPMADDATYFAPENLGCGDQGQCGSCFYCSACKVCSKALVQAGKLPNDDSKGMLSWQTNLDNCPGIDFGGCNGGDEGEVIAFIQSHGLPTTADYGPYTASSGRCNMGSLPLYKILDHGFCDPSSAANGVGSTQLIKNCIKAKGAVSVAAAAGGDWDSLGDGQIISGNSQGINHAIMLVGWDDSKGAWAMENQWGTSWGYTINGKPGRAWIKYGADGIGTEAIWVDAGQAPPPPPPPPPVYPPWTFDERTGGLLAARPTLVFPNANVTINLNKCGGCGGH